MIVTIVAPIIKAILIMTIVMLFAITKVTIL